MDREAPRVPSQLSECLGAGTGCHWCVPFLTRLHEQWQRGEIPDLRISPERYAANRARYRESGERPTNPVGENESRGSDAAS